MIRCNGYFFSILSLLFLSIYSLGCISYINVYKRNKYNEEFAKMQLICLCAFA